MSLTPTAAEQSILAGTLELEGAAMTRRERLAELLVGATFLGASAWIWWLRPPQALAIGPAALCVALFVLATMVRFDTPFGFTVATQLAFVPLLFAMPLAAVPIAVVVGLTLARVPAVLRGRTKPSRLLLVFGNSWFSIGPVTVLAVAGMEARDASPVILLAALVGQFVVDITVSTVRLWIARDATPNALLRDAWVYGVDAALSGIGWVVAEDIPTAPFTVLTVVPMLGLLAMFARERRDRLRSLIELGNAYRGTALVLGDVVEADDGYTGQHCKGVVALALEVGRQLGLDAEQLRDLEFAALLHDVGKIAIPKEIINKPGKLDPQEWTIIKTHTIEGQNMLNRVGGFMREVGLIVRSHHERWDGTGYPDGLAGEHIPLEARIIACCDTWNAMRTDRSYRKAMAHELALAELRANAGTQLDAHIVATLIPLVEPHHEIAAASSETAEPRSNLGQLPQTAASPAA